MNERKIQIELIRELLELLQRFQPGGVCGPIDDRNEWTRRVHAHTPERRELLQELTRFADLCRYLKERHQDLGPEILTSLAEVAGMALPDRIQRIRAINQQLMERIPNGGEDPGLWN